MPDRVTTSSSERSEVRDMAVAVKCRLRSMAKKAVMGRVRFLRRIVDVGPALGWLRRTYGDSVCDSVKRGG